MFCPLPFTRLEIKADGSVYCCCEGWLLNRANLRPAMNLPRHLQPPVVERAKQLKLRRPHVIHGEPRQRRAPPQHIAIITRSH